jgi:UDP-glucuronate decarboxylase
MQTALTFSPQLASQVRSSEYNFIVTGANGWMGRATLEMLHQALGPTFATRVTALGSRQSHIKLTDECSCPVQSLLEWKISFEKPAIIFHYAFLTKDKVSTISTEDYIERNEAISKTVREWISSGIVKGVVMPSSGAVYDFIQGKTRDPDALLYGQLKYKDEASFSAVCESNAASLIMPRLFNLSGPYINKFESYALSSFIVQVLKGNPINIHARQPVIRSYYYIGDLIELCLKLLFNQTSPKAECFDTASKEVVELSELAKHVASVMSNYSPAISQRLPMQSDAVENRYVGNRTRIEELEKRLGIKPISLEAQISLTSQYIQSVMV